MAVALVQLNDAWRVADDPPQWALQSRDGPQREKASGWAGRKSIRDRDHLLHRIDELCGNVDRHAIEIIEAWPVGYVTWKLLEMKARASPETAPHSAIGVDQHLASQCGAYRGQRHENPIMPRRIASQARNVP